MKPLPHQTLVPHTQVRLANFMLAADLSSGTHTLGVDVLADLADRGIYDDEAIKTWAKGEDAFMLGLTIAELIFSTLTAEDSGECSWSPMLLQPTGYMRTMSLMQRKMSSHIL